jgi:GNAT superfamily N-acetyltransferase
MQAYTIRPQCTVDDAAAIAQNNVPAFWAMTWWRILFGTPTMEPVLAAVKVRTRYRLVSDRDTYRHQAVVDAATGTLVGYARWILPREHVDAWPEARSPEVGEAEVAQYKAEYDATPLPEAENRSEMDEMDTPVNENQARLKPKEPYMTLDYLATHPGHQRRGISSMLVKSGIEQADKLGLKIYLMAKSRDATAFYVKNGFDLEWDLSQSLGRWGYDEDCYTAILIRRPAKKEAIDP